MDVDYTMGDDTLGETSLMMDDSIMIARDTDDEIDDDDDEEGKFKHCLLFKHEDIWVYINKYMHFIRSI